MRNPALNTILCSTAAVMTSVVCAAEVHAGPPAVIPSPVCAAEVGAVPPCAAFDFSNSDFSAVERDYNPSLLYVWSGKQSAAHGVAFLIDKSAGYYLTARHVAEAIAAPNQIVTGIDTSQHKVTLRIVDTDRNHDAALLQVVTFNGVTWSIGAEMAKLPEPWADLVPYELSLSNPDSENVTFSGLAYSEAQHVNPTSPKEDRFTWNEEGTQMTLRVNTDEGDSGAPVYNRKGLVIGIVIDKQRLS